MNDEKPNIKVVKDLIKNKAYLHQEYIGRCKEASQYYRNENDITRYGAKGQDSGPLRNADNRIPRNFHGLLVNQKAAYLFTAPPLFDMGKKNINKRITEILGDSYPKVCKDLCVNASNHEVAWLHYWINEKKDFCYAVVDSEQIIPLYCSDLDHALIAVLRTYRDIDFSTGKEITVWEYWDNKKCYSYFNKSDTISSNGLSAYYVFPGVDDESGIAKQGNVFEHEWGRVPFIPFYNNNIATNDLKNIKPLIDAYDKVFSGFLNDLEDIQEIIFVLTNYGGTDKEEFIDDLKTFKMIKLDSTEKDDKTGIQTIAINIPIEAREKFLEMTRKAIFEQGQGVDPDPQKFGNTSGEALKYLYSLLDLKAGLMETEFKQGFGELVRVICQYLGAECKQIIQTWTRSAIRSDTEQADICAKSDGIVSHKTILKNHPLVEDAEKEEKQIEKERQEEEKRMDAYARAFGGGKEDSGGDNIDGSDNDPEEE